ncbi:upstream stimulatory factor 1 isoform X1 [Lates japonicus]|uniref:Upstream stimulatory factor 1 isoform X1 n=1 Tax=Lates japonicus TaxID=270547 RepID=A0AAD3RM80_LATJO|nr:upstream stimulatory factor 1 isoform X1 [Lates japonicus]
MRDALQHLHIATAACSAQPRQGSPTPIEGKPQMMAPISRRKHLRWDLLLLKVVLEAIRTKMPSNGYGTAVGTSGKLNFGQGSSRVLTDSQLDPPAQGW